MEETIKIYAPKSNVKEEKTIWSKMMDELRKEESNLNFRYPWFNVVYNWVIAVLIVILAISLISWGLNVKTERKAEALTAIAMADYEATQKAELEAIAAAEDTIMQKESESLARIFYGISKFQDKYGYDDKDFFTLARCVFNRVENDHYASDLAEVVNQKDQWVGYFENNPVLSEYYDLAYKAVQEWHQESIKPISNDFVYAELTPNGVFLKNDFHADGYARRWRYGN